MNIALFSLGLVCLLGMCNSLKSEFETIKRFPHFVSISKGSYSYYNCSGSIIHHQWILTALNCVQYGRFSVHFLLESLFDTRHSFSLSLDETAVFPYPTGYDNIALVKLPISLKISELIQPIRYYTWNENYDLINNGFAVMPVPPCQCSAMTYGMYKVLCRRDCKTNFASQYDEFLELCSTDWNSNYQLTLNHAEGSGLIQGWPKDPHLIGIFSSSVYGNGKSGQLFIKLSKYQHWIDEVIVSHYPPTTTGPTTTFTYPPSYSTIRDASTTTTTPQYLPSPPTPPPSPPSGRIGSRK